MMRSMYAGVSGLKNHQTRLDVIGNNIANVNTTGFKSSRVVFQDMLSQTIRSGTAASSSGTGGTNAAQVGLGMIIGAIDTLHTQGNFESTGKSTDMAISGNGFFVLSNGVSMRYSRDGAFSLNSDNDLINGSNGYKVQGWTAVDNVVDTTGTIGSINIPLGSRMVSSATSNISLSGNLDASGTIASTGTVCSSAVYYDKDGAAADGDVLLTELENSTGTSLLSAGDVITIGGKKGDVTMSSATLTVGATTTVQDLLDKISETYGIYDDGTAGVSISAAGKIIVTGNDGTENALTDISLTAASSTGTAKADFNTIAAPDSENGFTETTAADGASITSSMVAYDSLGVAHTINVVYTKTSDNTWAWNADCADQSSGGTNVGNGTVTFDSAGGYEDSTGSVDIVLDSGATTPLAVSLDVESLTQLSADSAVSVSEQDGYAPGTLESFSIGSDGVITGVYTNGMTETLAQIALANFANPSGLTKDGNNLYSQATSSGVAQVGSAGSGGRGSISSGVLEMSNVDLAQEFTNMITTERGFQANAKIITTSDDMLQELVNLKR